jgi:hypothetical protein
VDVTEEHDLMLANRGLQELQWSGGLLDQQGKKGNERTHTPIS